MLLDSKADKDTIVFIFFTNGVGETMASIYFSLNISVFNCERAANNVRKYTLKCEDMFKHSHYDLQYLQLKGRCEKFKSHMHPD